MTTTARRQIARLSALASALFPGVAYGTVAVLEARPTLSTLGAILALISATGILVWRVARLDHRIDLRLTVLEALAGSEPARTLAAVAAQVEEHRRACARSALIDAGSQ